jgi:hypothetical protein
MIYAYMIIHGHLHAIYRYTHNINLLREGLFVCLSCWNLWNHDGCDLNVGIVGKPSLGVHYGNFAMFKLTMQESLNSEWFCARKFNKIKIMFLGKLVGTLGTIQKSLMS